MPAVPDDPPTPPAAQPPDPPLPGTSAPASDAGRLLALREGDFYMEGGCMVFTTAYHLRRGYCCGNRCRHCPYQQCTR
jgi:hypothetical protein